MYLVFLFCFSFFFEDISDVQHSKWIYKDINNFNKLYVNSHEREELSKFWLTLQAFSNVLILRSSFDTNDKLVSSCNVFAYILLVNYQASSAMSFFCFFNHYQNSLNLLNIYYFHVYTLVAPDFHLPSVSFSLNSTSNSFTFFQLYPFGTLLTCVQLIH